MDLSLHKVPAAAANYLRQVVLLRLPNMPWELLMDVHKPEEVRRILARALITAT